MTLEEFLKALIEGGGSDDCVPLPRFPRGEMYRGMEGDRRYALEELGL